MNIEEELIMILSKGEKNQLLLDWFRITTWHLMHRKLCMQWRQKLWYQTWKVSNLWISSGQTFFYDEGIPVVFLPERSLISTMQMAQISFHVVI